MLDVTAVVFSLIVLAIISVLLNALCIHIIRTSKSLRDKPSSIFVVNLLSVHLIQGLFVFPFYAGKKLKVSSLFWARFFANGFRFSYMLTFYGTCLGVLAISMDRFFAAYWLQKYKSRMSKKRVSVAVVCLWLYILLLCLLPFIPEEKPATNTVSLNPNLTNVTNTTRENSKSKPKFYFYVQQEEWVVFMLTFNTALPYVLIILCYMYIIHALKKMEHSRMRSRSRAESAVTLIDRHGKEVKFLKRDVEKYKQVTKLTFILTITYGLFWTPSIIYYPLKDMCKACFEENYEDSPLEQHVGYITKYLAFMDAAAAPLIYCFYHAEFRKSLLRIRSKIFRQPAPPEQSVVTGESTELL